MSSTGTIVGLAVTYIFAESKKLAAVKCNETSNTATTRRLECSAQSVLWPSAMTY